MDALRASVAKMQEEAAEDKPAKKMAPSKGSKPSSG
jgi:hypothetical protein